MNDVENPRIAITGLGMISPCGIGADAYLNSLLNGQSGIGTIDLFEGVTPLGRIGGQCRDFYDKSIKKEYLKAQRKRINVMCRDIQLGVAAANLAMEHSGLELNEEERSRLGVEFGADLMLSPPDVLFRGVLAARGEDGIPTDHNWGNAGLGEMEPLWLLKYLPNMPACHISIHADARGPSNSLTLEDASGNMTIGESMRIIRRGQADAMISGTTGARLHVIKSINYTNLNILADPQGADPAKVLRPFDKDRTGEVVGEGSCALILENEQLAQKRDAKIYGYVLGVGSSCVRTPKEGGNPKQALINAMQAALQRAEITPDQVGHINAHGAGSKSLDIQEAEAIREVFGEYGDKVPVTSLKPFTGNCGSGSGTLELAGSLLALQQGVVINTLNYETPDPACRLNIVQGSPKEVDNKIFLNLNVTRNGQASVVVAQAT